MAGDGHPTWHGESDGCGPNDGAARRRRSPTRGLFIGMGAAVMFASLLAVMGAIAAGSPAEDLPPPPVESPQAEATSSTVQNPTTIASSWSAGPTPVSPAPAPPAASDAVRLAGEADEAYDVRIVVDGQDWGADDAAQMAARRVAMGRDGHDLAPRLRPGLHVRSVFEQHADHIGMSLRGCPHERGLPASCAGVRVGT